jgi:Thioredoxin domain
MKVTVLGTGCYKCITLESRLNEVLTEFGRSSVTVDRVTDEKAIRRFIPVEAIPGLVIDGKLVHSGDVPSKDRLRQWLRAEN